MAKVTTSGLAGVPNTLKISEYAALTGQSSRNVQDLALRGVLVLDDKRRIKVRESLAGHFKHLREQAQGRKGDNGVDLAGERALLAKEQRLEVQMRNAKLRGELIPVQDVKEGWTRFASVVRIAFLGLPTKIISAVPHMSPHDGQVVAEVCRNVLIDASEELKDGVVMGARPDDLVVGSGDVVDLAPKARARKRKTA